MTLRPVVIDFESLFGEITPPPGHPHLDSNYSLSSMSTESYIRDPRFEAHGAAIKWSANHPARWYDERALRQVLKDEDWSDVFLIAWHCAFDGLILTHHYGVRPKMWGCPMSMARLLLPAHLSVSLDNVRKHLGMSPKITPYNLFKGLHWSEMSEDVRNQVARGAEDEVESIWHLFKHFGQQFPAEEYEIVDSIVDMFVNPALQADVPLLAQIWEKEDADKSRRMAALGVVAGDLQSSARFADLLRAEGVEPETKTSPKGNTIYAFAKTDDFMRDLLDDENERVRTLAEARLGAKSTIMQTRAETLGFMATRNGPAPAPQTPLCVYLRYCGAATLRPTGGDDTNFLNMKRQSPIRKTLLAPEGYWLAPLDSSQIECRVLHYLAGGSDEPVIQKFRAREDPYVDLASLFYKETIYKPRKGDPRFDEMEAKRGMGKQGRLMCGYGAAGKQFKITAKNGLYGPSVEISIEDANAFVALYRQENPSVTARNTGYWAQAERMIARLAGGPPLDWGPLHVKDGKIYLPNGTMMHYDSLEFHRPDGDEEVRDFERDGYWRLRTKRGWKKLWGSKLTQNICEAVSRVVISQALVRIKRMGVRTLNWPYDELLLLISKGDGDRQLLEDCKAEMVQEVPWLPGLPLDCEGELSERYSK